MSTVHTSSKNSWLLHHNDISASKDFTAKTCESKTSTTNLKENLKAFCFVFFSHLESSMIRWTICLRSPQNSVPSERHSVPSKRNLLFLFDSNLPIQGKTCHEFAPDVLFQTSNSRMEIEQSWKSLLLDHGGIVSPFVQNHRTKPKTTKVFEACFHVLLFQLIFLPTKCFESQNNFDFG